MANVNVTPANSATIPMPATLDEFKALPLAVQTAYIPLLKADTTKAFIVSAWEAEQEKAKKLESAVSVDAVLYRSNWASDKLTALRYVAVSSATILSHLHLPKDDKFVALDKFITKSSPEEEVRFVDSIKQLIGAGSGTTAGLWKAHVLEYTPTEDYKDSLLNFLTETESEDRNGIGLTYKVVAPIILCNPTDDGLEFEIEGEVVADPTPNLNLGSVARQKTVTLESIINGLQTSKDTTVAYKAANMSAPTHTPEPEAETEGGNAPNPSLLAEAGVEEGI